MLISFVFQYFFVLKLYYYPSVPPITVNFLCSVLVYHTEQLGSPCVCSFPISSVISCMSTVSVLFDKCQCCRPMIFSLTFTHGSVGRVSCT